MSTEYVTRVIHRDNHMKSIEGTEAIASDLTVTHYYNELGVMLKKQNTLPAYKDGEARTFNWNTYKKRRKNAGFLKSSFFSALRLKEHIEHVKQCLSKEGKLGISEYHPIHQYTKIEYTNKLICVNCVPLFLQLLK